MQRVYVPNRDEIVKEIQRVAKQLGRTPGRKVFERESGIRESEWYGVIWRSWNDAVSEAGLNPNEKQSSLEPEFLLAQYSEAVRHFDRIPANVDLRMYTRYNQGFPNERTLRRHFGNKKGLLEALAKFVRSNEDYADLIELIPESEDSSEPASESRRLPEGYVYLLKSGKHYKIGRSDELERRVKQIAVNLPEAVTLEHAIRTDDPPGIEAYWHRRFAEKRANGEWFKLSAADLRAFKRRTFQ